jgi:hypothetical protein
MFVGCQMPTDGTGNNFKEEAEDTTQTVDADEVYGFVPKTVYNVYAPNGDFMLSKNGEYLIYAAKELNFVKEVDYTIVDTDVPLTESGINKVYTNGGMPKDTTTTYTVDLPKENYTTANSSYKLVIQNAPIDGYKKGDQVEILITNGTQNASTGWETPEGLYLVNVRIEDKSTGNDIKSTVGLKVENNKIKFTMPSNNVDVYASFEDVVCRAIDVVGDIDHFPNWFGVNYSGKSPFLVALNFGEKKEYDNLEPFGKDFIYKLESAIDGGSKNFYIQLGKDCNVYDKNNPKNCKYYENPVVIYNDKMYEPTIDTLGNRYVKLDSQN